MDERWESSKATERERRILDLALALCRIESVSAQGEGENRAIDLLRDRLSRTPHFRAHPEDLRLLEAPEDPRGRRNLMAFVPAAERTPRTLILTGHVDVVDVGGYGDLAPWAFDPEELTRRMGGRALPPDARKDWESGNFLFGRGIMDMKTGIAIETVRMERAAEDPSSQGINLLFCPVFDEENNSAGMTALVPHLVRFARERGMDYLACVNAEPCDLGGGEERARMILLGSVGKIMPLFYVFGREAHVGEYEEGLNALGVLARISGILEGNPEFSESLGKEHYPPMTCLASSDRRGVYSVTLPERAFAFYNRLTVSRTPGRLLEEMRAVAERALREALGAFGRDPDRLGSPRVLAYGELLASARERDPGLDARILDLARSRPGSGDERSRGIEVLEAVAEAAGLRGPAVVVGFLPPYYPHRGNRGRSGAERRVRAVADRLIRFARDRHGERLGTIEYFGGITDLSYMGFQGDPTELEALGENLPGWGTLYSLPTEDLLKLDVPVLNVGPAGRDAHKETERLELGYSLRVAPALLDEAIRAFAEAEDPGKGEA
jgi:arginine utilization protein RocB